MSGGLVAIVGPSGSGKDSLLRALGRRLTPTDGVLIARRVVTRPSDANEDHDTLGVDAFLAAARAGAFALTWTAHGLHYGVPARLDADIAGGQIVLCNLSRAALPTARIRYPRVLAVAVSASPEMLAARLAARGREGVESRRGRLARANAAEAEFEPDIVIENNGPLADAVLRLYTVVMSFRAGTIA